MPSEKLIIKKFAELNTTELYNILNLRNRVFVVEQNCPYQDTDGAKDFSASHLMCYHNHELAGYCRLIPPQTASSHVAIGRVVVAPEYRGLGIARRLMEHAIAQCQQSFAEHPIHVQAQAYLRDFYASLGFIATSEVYLEDNIPHLDMVRER